MMLMEAMPSVPLVVVQLPSRTYRDTGKTLSGYVDGINAIKQAITHMLLTERYSNPTYGRNYGREFNKYKNASFDYLKTTIESTLREALTQDDRISDVLVTGVEKTSINSVLVSFNVYTTMGILEEQRTIEYGTV